MSSVMAPTELAAPLSDEEKKDDAPRTVRPRRTAAKGKRPPPNGNDERPPPHPKKPKQEHASELDMAWICHACHEAECLLEPADFVICDGPCRGIFHTPCADLPELPVGDWYCKDCTARVHACAICHESGSDDWDVFACDKETCGLFFHESCLAVQGVQVAMEMSMEGTAESEEKKLVPKFICPAHSCWTCTQQDDKDQEQKKEAADAASTKGGKKRKKKKKQASIFQTKTESRLFRCLYCPLAYHGSCIPPMSRFHELAVLCHEHSGTHKLPELDLSTSFQKAVDDKIDRKLEQMDGRIRRRRAAQNGSTKNPFVPVRGDAWTKEEVQVMDHLQVSELSFCLPCDVQQQVHSKPTSYTHIHGLKYDTNHKPKRIPAGEEQCQCTAKCGDDCFNRMLLVECHGDGSGKGSNCWVGGDDCGNRALGKRQFVKCKPKREGGKGWGLTTVQAVPKGKLVQEYIGEVVDEKEKERRLQEWSKEHPNDPNFYVMALNAGWYIDAREYANMSRFINHSCDPNCTLVSINVKGYKRCGIFAKRDIAAGEFLSYDYQFDTKHGDYFACRCGAASCRGTMMGGKGKSDNKPLSWKEAKQRYDLDKAFLEETERNAVTSQVGALIPAAEQPTDFVFAGPPEKHRDTIRRNGICLWRNARLGADFLARASRLEASKPKDATKKLPLNSLSTGSPLAKQD